MMHILNWAVCGTMAALAAWALAHGAYSEAAAWATVFWLDNVATGLHDRLAQVLAASQAFASDAQKTHHRLADAAVRACKDAKTLQEMYLQARGMQLSTEQAERILAAARKEETTVTQAAG